MIELKAGMSERNSMILRQLSEITKKCSNRKKLIGARCPTCGCRVKRESVSDFLKHLSLEYSKLKLEKSSVRTKIKTLDRRLRNERKKLSRLQSRQEKHKASVITRKNLQERLHSAVGSSSDLESELETASSAYAKSVSRLLIYRYEEQTLRSQIKDLEFWVAGFGNRGVKALIVREALPAMNAKLKEYAEEIFEGKAELEFKASKQTQAGEERELFNLSYRTSRNADSYTAESSGGRRRVDICVLLVFAWFSRLCNVLFVDELLDGLDASGREAVLAILSKQRGTVFVVSHNRELKSRVGKVWTVRKKSGCSTIDFN
jgi:DNA repair exonuclease SbcCD ATPase subunit